MKHPDITIISDDDDFPSEMQKSVVSVRKQASNAQAQPCCRYKLHFPRGQQAHTSYPFALHTAFPLTWDYSGQHMAFSSSHTFALELLEEMDDVNDVMTCVTTNMFRTSWQGLQMAYTRMQHLYTMASAALSKLYTGRQKQSIFFAFVVAMT